MNLKRFLSTLVLIALILTSVPFFSLANTSDFTFELNEDGQSYTLTAYSGSASEVVIPSEYDEKAVTAIASYAFSGNNTMTSVNVPESIVTICAMAFSECTALTSLTLYNEKIETMAFSRCGGVEAIALGYGVKTVAREAFAMCTALKTISVSSSVTSISSDAFLGCKGIESIAVDSGNTAYRSENNCLIRSDTNTLVVSSIAYDIPESVSAIGSYAYYGHEMTAMYIPENIKRIEYNAFATCPNLKKVSLPGVEYIGERAFYMCDELTTVVFGTALAEIGNEAFGNCSEITSYTFPETLKAIGDKAFWYNSVSLTETFIPASVETMGAQAFYGCGKVTDIYCEAESIPEGWNTDWLGNCGASVHWGSTDKSAEGFVFELNEDETSYIITEYNGTSADVKIPYYYEGLNVTEIGDNAFYMNEAVETVILTEIITAIGDNAFMGCENLTEISIPASVTSIGTNPFSYCPSMTKLTVASDNKVYHSYKNTIIDTEAKKLISGINGGDIASDGSVTAIAEYAFRGQSAIIQLFVPETVTEIGDYAFSDCTSLTMSSIYNPDAVIGTNLYDGCSSLSSVGLPQNIVKIPDYTFKDCSSLSAYNPPSKVEEFGEGAFYGCSSLLAGGFLYNSPLTTIGDYAFYGCTSFTSFTLDVNVSSIGIGAFAYCTSLEKFVNYENESFYIDGNCLIEKSTGRLVAGCNYSTAFADPDAIKEIADQAFIGMTDIIEFVIPETVTYIGESAFWGCEGLTSIFIPGSVVTIGGSVFCECKNMTDIYCVASEQPSGWDADWLFGCDATVNWGYSAARSNLNEVIDSLKSLKRENFADEEWAEIQAAIENAESADLDEMTEAEINDLVDALADTLLLNPSLKEFGDIDGDETVGSLDYLFVKRNSFGTFTLNDAQKARADIDRNGVVDSIDYLLVKRMAFGTFKMS